MAPYQSVFKRYEKKYLLQPEQAAAFRRAIEPYMRTDAYGRTTICSVYMDTPDYRLIRASLEKPVYKEKLRLRTYGVPKNHGTAFVEIKKKYKGVVYKRRVSMPYTQAEAWLFRGEGAPGTGQIESEIEWFMQTYAGIAPAADIFYERIALYGIEDPGLRITLDERIRYRTRDLSLTSGPAGELLIAPGEQLVEIKAAGAMPVWLASTLSALEIFPTSFSKYGSAYRNMMEKKEAMESA